MVSQLTVIDAAFLSRARAGVTRKMHEEKEERDKREERGTVVWQAAGLADPLRARATQQQIAAQHTPIFS